MCACMLSIGIQTDTMSQHTIHSSSSLKCRTQNLVNYDETDSEYDLKRNIVQIKSKFKLLLQNKLPKTYREMWNVLFQLNDNYIKLIINYITTYYQK